MPGNKAPPPPGGPVPGYRPGAARQTAKSAFPQRPAHRVAISTVAGNRISCILIGSGHLGDKPRFRMQPPQDTSLPLRRFAPECPLKCRTPPHRWCSSWAFPHRAAGRPSAAPAPPEYSPTPSGCAPKHLSCGGGLFCIKPTIGSSSGSTTPMTSTYSRSTGAAAGPHSSLSSSAFTRSGERFFSRGGAFPRRAAAVPRLDLKPQDGGKPQPP